MHEAKLVNTVVGINTTVLWDDRILSCWGCLWLEYEAVLDLKRRKLLAGRNILCLSIEFCFMLKERNGDFVEQSYGCGPGVVLRLRPRCEIRACLPEVAGSF